MAVKEVQKSKQEKQRELMEYIHGYTPSERLPFACRLCKFQGASEEELWQHRAGEAHKRAVELEKKACFCRLCRKQFTSAVQLSEHLKGAAHAATLERRMRASGQCVEIKPTGVGAGQEEEEETGEGPRRRRRCFAGNIPAVVRGAH